MIARKEAAPPPPLPNPDAAAAASTEVLGPPHSPKAAAAGGGGGASATPVSTPSKSKGPPPGPASAAVLASATRQIAPTVDDTGKPIPAWKQKILQKRLDIDHQKVLDAKAAEEHKEAGWKGVPGRKRAITEQVEAAAVPGGAPDDGGAALAAAAAGSRPAGTRCGPFVEAGSLAASKAKLTAPPPAAPKPPSLAAQLQAAREAAAVRAPRVVPQQRPRPPENNEPPPAVAMALAVKQRLAGDIMRMESNAEATLAEIASAREDAAKEASAASAAGNRRPVSIVGLTPTMELSGSAADSILLRPAPALRPSATARLSGAAPVLLPPPPPPAAAHVQLQEDGEWNHAHSRHLASIQSRQARMVQRGFWATGFRFTWAERRNVSQMSGVTKVVLTVYQVAYRIAAVVGADVADASSDDDAGDNELPALPMEMWDSILEFLHFGGNDAFSSAALAPVHHPARRELELALRRARGSNPVSSP